MSITLLNPVQDVVGVTSHGAERLSTLEGKTLGLYCNGKFKGAELLELIADRLGSEFDLKGIVRGDYPVSHPMEDGGWLGIDQVDAVVLAIGDCGSCSSSGVMNAIQLEKMGVPTLLVSTTAFFGVCTATKKIAGMPDFEWAAVEHPVGNATPEGLADRADYAVERFHEVILAGADLDAKLVGALSAAR